MATKLFVILLNLSLGINFCLAGAELAKSVTASVADSHRLSDVSVRQGTNLSLKCLAAPSANLTDCFFIDQGFQQVLEARREVPRLFGYLT